MIRVAAAVGESNSPVPDEKRRQSLELFRRLPEKRDSIC